MTFQPLFPPSGQRVDGVLSADKTQPDRYAVIDLLRRAAPGIGLKPPVLQTLEALLSFLPPNRSHHMVFASNATLCFRRNGITERTLRRHIERLEDVGLIRRCDSSNRKRFVRRDPLTGEVLRFGFDLSCLFEQLPHLEKLAETLSIEAEHRAFLRLKLRTLAHARVERDQEDSQAIEAIKLLRRNVTVETLEQAVNELEDSDTATDGTKDKKPVVGGHNVRHLHSSKKEYTDLEDPAVRDAVSRDAPRRIDLDRTCPKAMEFAATPLTREDDIVVHGQSLANMLGIRRSCYDAAQQKLGGMGAALAVFLVMEVQDRLRNIGAYFQAITTGRKSKGFDPIRAVEANFRLKAGQGVL